MSATIAQYRKYINVQIRKNLEEVKADKRIRGKYAKAAMPRQKRTERLNLTIDQTLKRQFDAVCALKGLSMSEINQKLIAQWVKENAPPGMLEESAESAKDDKSLAPAKGKGGKGSKE
jgi:antitoxin component of RelBE/YafQ-DinJ toxin-antitoxin module